MALLERVVSTPAAAPWPPPFCPECGAEVESHVGVIEAPVITPYGQMTRSKVLGKYTVCTRCHWGIEDATGD